MRAPFISTVFPPAVCKGQSSAASIGVSDG
jgi:hypothetical protein